VAVVAVLSSAAKADVLYVDDDAGLNGDGSSWGTAYRFLQDALANANDSGGVVTTIHVAQGTYKPDQDESGHVTPGDRAATFQLINGVALKGGFAGTAEPDPDERDIVAFETILCGDLLGDDGPDFANNDENSFHVVTSLATDETAVLDGFTISAGNAAGATSNRGGGIWNSDSASPSINACTIKGNTAGHGGGMSNSFGCNPTITGSAFIGNSSNNFGGGLSNSICSPVIANCQFIQNSALAGGGLHNHSSSPLVSNCVFSGNTAGSGGGMSNQQGSSPTVIGCIYLDNSTTSSGGGVANTGGSHAEFLDCAFIGNSTDVGGAMFNQYSDPLVVNTTFSHNSADIIAGGVQCEESEPLLVNCTLSANTTGGDGGGIHVHSGLAVVTSCILWENVPDQIAGNATVTYSDVEGGWSGTGNIDADPQFVDPDNGDFRLAPGSQCIDAADNTAVPEDITTDLDGKPRFLEIPETPDTGLSGHPQPGGRLSRRRHDLHRQRRGARRLHRRHDDGQLHRHGWRRGRTLLCDAAREHFGRRLLLLDPIVRARTRLLGGGAALRPRS
jgi:hypothetical protein